MAVEIRVIADAPESKRGGFFGGNKLSVKYRPPGAKGFERGGCNDVESAKVLLSKLSAEVLSIAFGEGDDRALILAAMEDDDIRGELNAFLQDKIDKGELSIAVDEPESDEDEAEGEEDEAEEEAPAEAPKAAAKPTAKKAAEPSKSESRRRRRKRA